MSGPSRMEVVPGTTVAYADHSQGLAETVDTPALFVDRVALDHNLQLLEKVMEHFPDVSVRPHAKAHKSGKMAALQLNAHRLRCTGLCAQKVTEARALIESGAVDDVLISNEIVAASKLKQVALLAKRPGVRLRVCVDNPDNVRALSEVAAACHTTIGLLVDVDVGQKRCGVSSPAEALQLAELIKQLPGVRFDGIQAYHGLLQHIQGQDARREAVEVVAAQAKAVVDTLEESGVSCPIVTGGGTGTFFLEAATGVFTEVQPGSYIFMDAAYGRDEWRLPGVGAECWQHSLFVLATVVSRNEERRLAVVDAGLKAVSLDMGPPVVCSLGASTFSSGGDEHGMIHVDKNFPLPAVGSVIQLIPGHCDPTVNMYEQMLIVRDGEVEEEWTIVARGPGN